MDGFRLMEKWQDANKAYHFENNTKNLEKLVEAIGYRADAFGTSVENFLNDNPGAQVAIVDWITEWLDRNRDWREALQAEVEPDEDLEDEEE